MILMEYIFSIGFLACIGTVLYVALRGIPDEMPFPNLDLPEAPSAVDRGEFARRAKLAMIENKRISEKLGKAIAEYNKASGA